MSDISQVLGVDDILIGLSDITALSIGDLEK
jgi:2-keto-3-deoxy-L-rhamnonate aldolase RhmA